jgi:hypothetical protein
MNRILRRGAALAAGALLLVMAASVVLANATLLGGKLRTGDTVTVPAGETVHGDLYVLGGRVTVQGNVDGDLTALGGQVEINGTVTGDLLAAGGTISLAGTVNGDARVFGGQLNLAGSVDEDLAVTGGQVTVPAGGKIGGDLIVSGGQVTISGAIAGSIEGSAGTYSRSGSVGGTEHVAVAPTDRTAAIAGETLFDALRQFVVVVLAGALLLWWRPRGMAAADGVLRTRPLMAVGGGLAVGVGYIVFLVVAILAMVVLALLFGLLRIGSLIAIDVVAGTLAISLVSFLFVLAVAFVADALVGLALAHMVMRTDGRDRWQELGLLAAGAAAVVIVTTIPVVGGWVKLAVVLLGLGALSVAWWEAWRAGRKSSVSTQPSA